MSAQTLSKPYEEEREEEKKRLEARGWKKESWNKATWTYSMHIEGVLIRKRKREIGAQNLTQSIDRTPVHIQPSVLFLWYFFLVRVFGACLLVCVHAEKKVVGGGGGVFLLPVNKDFNLQISAKHSSSNNG